MPRRSGVEAAIDSEQSIRDAIKYAQKYAGANDADFVRALNVHFQNRKARRERAAIPAAEAEQPTKSFHIYEDPRYLTNARELTRRTLGGLRVIGGAPVKKGEFLDCVAVGSNGQWGCTGTLVPSNAVVTAGHCADFATRVFFGNDVSKPGKVVRVKKRVRHSKYHQGRHSDLMVLLLEEKVDSVNPRKLAAKVDALDWVCCGVARNYSLNPVVYLRCVGKRWRQESEADPTQFEPVIPNHFTFRKLKIDRFLKA
jgi:hypothetical protein